MYLSAVKVGHGITWQSSHVHMVQTEPRGYPSGHGVFEQQAGWHILQKGVVGVIRNACCGVTEGDIADGLPEVLVR